MHYGWQSIESSRRLTASGAVIQAACLALFGSMAWLFASQSPWRETHGSSLLPAAAAQEKAETPAAENVSEPAAENASAPEAKGTSLAFRFDIPLPIRGGVDEQVRQRVEQALRKLPKEGPRPTFIFEFRPRQGTAGEGSDFGRALSLARYLSGDRLSQVRTVAWIPQTIKGHSVLPALACEQIIMRKEAEIGAAGHDEPSLDDTLRGGYTEIAERRRTMPAAIALGLLDKDLAVFKVTTQDGVRYETGENLAKLRQEGVVTKEETIFQPGEPHTLSGAQMRFALGIASHLAEDRRSLAAALQLPVAALQQQQIPDEGWRPIRINLSSPVHHKAVNSILRTIADQQNRGDFNLLILHISSGGGDPAESLRLAQQLSSLGPKVYSVAYVDRQARGDAAIIATACDELIMTPDAMLGGPGEKALNEDDLAALKESLADVSHKRGRDWSLPLALVDPRVEVFRYTRALGGDVRYLSSEEYETLPDAEQWERAGGSIDTSRGITGLTAEELGLARAIVANFHEVKALYQIEGELQPKRPNWALAFIERLADPQIAWILLFVGLFALMFEMSTPGIGAPAFVAGVCFLLFFWSQFLHGTAGWLEIILFVGGITCLAIELFVLPGLGVFGLGGAVMVITSIVLASQTFVLPTNAYQLRQFPISLLMVASGMAGGIAAIAVIRRFLPDTPYFNRMMLAPPAAEERELLSRREALVAWDHLAGKRGVTTTPLVPAGKAQFGDELVDVISSGELVPKGTPVVVAEVAGNRVIVRRAS